MCAGAQEEFNARKLRSMLVRGKERAEVLTESLALGYCSQKGKYSILDKTSEGLLTEKVRLCWLNKLQVFH